MLYLKLFVLGLRSLIVPSATLRLENLALRQQLADGRFTEQVAREFTGDGGFLEGKRILLHDRDSKFTHEFRPLSETPG